MTVWVLAVGRPGRLLAPAIAEYERRAARYWRLEAIEVREARRGRDPEGVRAVESERLLARAPAGAELVALTRTGRAWSSVEFADYLARLAAAGHPGPAFLIGGAYGLADEALRAARHRLSLSAMTLPHDVARLVLAEQLYRAGTIRRGEPYHKGGP